MFAGGGDLHIFATLGDTFTAMIRFNKWTHTHTQCPFDRLIGAQCFDVQLLH